MKLFVEVGWLVSKTIILVRGISSSGKSTLARSLAARTDNFPVPSTPGFDTKSRVKEADHYWEFQYPGTNTGPTEYRWDPRFIRNAHEWCFAEMIRHLFVVGDDYVFVANTFTRAREMQRYIDFAHNNDDVQIRVCEPITDWCKNVQECFKRNTHNVPLATIQKMYDRWQPSDLLFSDEEILDVRG